MIAQRHWNRTRVGGDAEARDQTDRPAGDTYASAGDSGRLKTDCHRILISGSAGIDVLVTEQFVVQPWHIGEKVKSLDSSPLFLT